MAITHLSTIFCDYMIRADDGKLSYIGAFRAITSPMLPIEKSPLCICVEFAGQLGDPFKVVLAGEGFNLVLGEGVFSPLNDRPINTWAAVIKGEINARFETPGLCEVILSSGDNIIHRAALSVTVQDTKSNSDEAKKSDE